MLLRLMPNRSNEPPRVHECGGDARADRGVSQKQQQQRKVMGTEHRFYRYAEVVTGMINMINEEDLAQ